MSQRTKRILTLCKKNWYTFNEEDSEGDPSSGSDDTTYKPPSSPYFSEFSSYTASDGVSKCISNLVENIECEQNSQEKRDADNIHGQFYANNFSSLEFEFAGDFRSDMVENTECEQNSQERRDADNIHGQFYANNFSSFDFEFADDFKEESIFKDEVIKKLKQVFSAHNFDGNFVKKCPENTAKRVSVYDSPFLTINKYKKTNCKFCENQIVSKHFARHLQRNHACEKEVQEIFALDAQSKERKRLIAIIRNEGNLQCSIEGQIIPKKKLKRDQDTNKDEYAICIYCKAYYKRLFLSRHIKTCFVNKELSTQEKRKPLTESLVYSACQKKYGEILNALSVKKEIFYKMQADIITETAIGDILIAFYGDDMLKKNKKKRSLYHISNKLRECSKFLLQIRKLGSYPDMLSTLNPESFDNVIEATKMISRYDLENRTFGAASLALHFGTTLKNISDLAMKLILRQKIPFFLKDKEKSLRDLERFQKLVESQWCTELGSLALKDLNEKSSQKPKLLPLTEDIIKLKTLTEKTAENAYNDLKNSKTVENYKILAETTLVSTILHNRKRVGDIQYLDINAYNEQMENTLKGTVQVELATSLTENEKILTQNYKRMVAVGKGSRPVVILIPKNLQKYYSMIYNIRKNSTWFPPENTYFFTYPKSLRWIDGCSTIRKYAKKSDAKHPELLTSCRLRKHIATVTQVLSLEGT